jgi:hypothetical protein
MTATNGHCATANGVCLCGAVRFLVRGALRPIVFCHCGQCRRVHGHYAAYTAAPRESIELGDQAALKWFDSSPHARRGFCGICGSSLFWVPANASYWGITVGALDPALEFECLRHVYVADKASYYDIHDDLPQLPGSQRAVDA